MNLGSPFVLFVFLPLVLAGYWICGHKQRNVFLLLSSMFFYAWGDGRYVLVLCAALTANYFFGILIDRSQNISRIVALTVAIIANLVILISFKYLNFIVDNFNVVLKWIHMGSITINPIHMPLGISFFTFQALAYVIDVYREEHGAERDLVKFSLFMSLFPKITAGPIIRYQQIEAVLQKPVVSIDDASYGAKRFIWGLGKKLVIADTLAKTADQIFLVPGGELTAGLAWLGIICYTLQIYFDFSGYTDMAIGIGRMLGFKLMENFDYPYISKSLTEFWRRWHISLSTWFRDYLYTPLSYALMTESVRRKIAAGKYKTNYRGLLSVFIVFSLCGFWHGANWNFIVWGMFHGVLLALENWKLSKILKNMCAPLAHAYFILVIIIGWVFFRTANLNDAFVFLKTLAGFGTGNGVVFHPWLYIKNDLLLVMIIGIIGSMPTVQALNKCFEKIATAAIQKKVVPMIDTVASVLVLMFSLTCLAGSTYAPFIYANF